LASAMTAPSALISATVLALVVTMVLGFAFGIQQIRHSYLMQLETRLERTKEVISVGALGRGTFGVIDIANVGGSSVFIKTLKVAVTFNAYHENRSISQTDVKVFENIHLSPQERKFIPFSIEDKVPRGATKAEIARISVIVTTDKNVFVFDPAPSSDIVMLEIHRGNIGEVHTIYLPNGKVAKLSAYEYLICGVGPDYRGGTVSSPVDAVKVLVATSPEQIERPYEAEYVYSFDPKNRRFPDTDITVESEVIKVREDAGGQPKDVEVTTCTISSSVDLHGQTVVVSRGLLLVGTQLSGYDIVFVSFAGEMYPEFVSPDKVVGGVRTPNYLTDIKQQAYVLKIPLMSKDVLVYDFLATQVTPYIIAGDKQTSIHIGHYYSQAVLVGQSCVGRVSTSTTQVKVYVKFDYAYPILVIIAPAILEGSGFPNAR